jgi:anti-anti-sigma factor
MTGRLTVAVERRGRVAVVRVGGHLGIEGHHALKVAVDGCLADPEVSALRLNLAAVEFADATAVGLLLVQRERCRQRDKSLALTGCSGLAAEGLALDVLERYFPVL